MTAQTLHDNRQCHVGDMDMTVLCAMTGSSVLLAPSNIMTALQLLICLPSH